MDLVAGLIFAALLIYALGREHGARHAERAAATPAPVAAPPLVQHDDKPTERRVEIQYRCRGCGYQEIAHQRDRPDLSVGDVYLAPGGQVTCPGCRAMQPMVVTVVGESVAPPR